jgi:tripartite-type tricarboxylate transporter receptor subunit TctC
VKRVLVLLALLFSCHGAASAQSATATEFPQRTVTLVVPFAPGGATDVLARDIAQKLGEQLKQNVIVDNRPGAGTTIGTALVAKAAPDGYTLLFAPTPFAISQVMYPKLPYDAARDFAPVTLLAGSPFILVAHPALPANDIPELVALAKARPGSLSFASAGNGTVPHLAGELFKLRTGTDLVHVPYRGGGPAIVDLVAGQVQLMFATPVEVAQQVTTGRLKVLATTAPSRMVSYPGAPTMLESGVRDYDARSWFGVLAPAGTPPPVIDRLAGAFARAVEAPEIRTRFDSQGVEIQLAAGKDFGDFITRNIALWAEVVKASGAKID